MIVQKIDVMRLTAEESSALKVLSHAGDNDICVGRGCKNCPLSFEDGGGCMDCLVDAVKQVIKGGVLNDS